MRIIPLILISYLCVLLSACGIAFGGAPEGNDFFVSFDVTGEKVAGRPLTAALTYETIYPFEVEIVCELREEKDLVREVARGRAAAVPEGLTPDDDRVAGDLVFDFVVDEPGDFHVECYTPLDEANFIIEGFEIEAAE